VLVERKSGTSPPPEIFLAVALAFFKKSRISVANHTRFGKNVYKPNFIELTLRNLLFRISIKPKLHSLVNKKDPQIAPS